MEHVSVLPREVMEVLKPHDGGRYFDGTIGGGGHARTILELCGPSGHLAGTDLDTPTLERVRTDLGDYASRTHLFNDNFAAIDRVCLLLGWDSLDGILVDLGMSSIALDDPSRGLSFSKDGPLDMRFSPEAPLTAHEVVNEYPVQELTRIIRTFGEERWAARIAQIIVRSRPLNSTSELADTVARAIPRSKWPDHIHPATRTFQAIRMEVNHELESLETFLPKAAALLNVGGTMAVISFHSLEDRMVKRFFAGNPETKLATRRMPIELDTGKPKLEPVTRKPILATPEEIAANPRSRSARLRAARRVA